MTSTEDRIRKLIDENLEVDGRPLGPLLDLNISLIEAGVSSMDLVAFAKLVSQEFNVAFSPDDCAKLNSVRDLIGFLDSHAGLFDRPWVHRRFCGIGVGPPTCNVCFCCRMLVVSFQKSWQCCRHTRQSDTSCGREANALAWLNEKEQSRWQHYRHAGPRRRFALCRAALRAILCSQLGCRNEQLAFGISDHGEPYAVVNGIPAAINFHVSLHLFFNIWAT